MFPAPHHWKNESILKKLQSGSSMRSASKSIRLDFGFFVFNLILRGLPLDFFLWLPNVSTFEFGFTCTCQVAGTSKAKAQTRLR